MPYVRVFVQKNKKEEKVMNYTVYRYNPALDRDEELAVFADYQDAELFLIAYQHVHMIDIDMLTIKNN